MTASIPNEIRRLIYRRDGYACALCGDARNLHIHHVIPRSTGGGNSEYNLVTLCRYCHSLIHGVCLTEEEPMPPEEVELSAVEYVSDMYAGKWQPLMKLDYSNPEVIAMEMFSIEATIHRRRRGF